jgi:hypothetical protein
MTGSLLRALVTWNPWLLSRPAAWATGLAPLAGFRWFRAGCSRSFLERACHADRLVLGSSGSSRHWSHSALVSAGSAQASWSPLVQLGPAGLRWFSSGRATSLARRWFSSGHATSLAPRWFSSGRATSLAPRWFSSGRLVFAVCACRTPQSPGRSPSGLARSSLPPISSVTIGPPREQIPLEFGCSRQFHTCGHLVLTVPRVR